MYLWSSEFIYLLLVVISRCHNKMLPTTEREFILNHCSFSLSTSLFVWTSPCFHVWPFARLPLAQQLQLCSSWPAFKEGRGAWRIMSSHFVLGEVSTGLWKDGFHLSPCWLWRMATYLCCVCDGPRPVSPSAEWNLQLPKRRAGLSPCLHAT